MSKFKYEERRDCVCGEPLQTSGKSVEKEFAWGQVRFQQCRQCGTWCQSPQLRPDSLSAWYDSDEYQGSGRQRGAIYADYLADEDHRTREAQLRYDAELAGILPKASRVLEVGCATGSQLAAIRGNGHDVVGIDLSSRFVAAAKSMHGLDILLGDVMHADLPLGSFDAILLLGTVSNLRDCVEHMDRFRQLLKDDGLLVFNYADADSWIAKHVYRSSYWMFSPTAYNFMTGRGVAALLRRTGFALVRSRTDRQSPSLQKLFKHAKLSALLPVLAVLGMEHASSPWRVPIPGVRLVVARRDK
jgi:SAM-dependent methyltransferase